MRRLFRPSFLVSVSAGLALAAAALVFWPRVSDRAEPLPVEPGDQEIVWLSQATNIRDWERFVTAVRRSRPPGLPLIVDDSRAFPRETTEVPELRVRVAGKEGTLLFRWYKLTGDLKSSDWITAFQKRQPAPLAIIAGNSSQNALRLAHLLQDKATGPGSPLFLITQATADKDPTTEVPLPSIYPGRTFRFCFSNRQMAGAVSDFVWNRDNLLPEQAPLRQVLRFFSDEDPLPPAEDTLRPDADPAYLVIWQDDPYSKDLADSFMDALRLRALQSTAQDWGWATGFAVHGGFPLNLAAVRRGRFYMAGQPASAQFRVFHSIGSFDRPNHPEEEKADQLLREFASHPDQERPLLVLPANSQACRRFLRGLRRSAPVMSRQFTVVTGDSIEFNKIYRDRNLTWPIQDLPIKLVIFCHRNPVARSLGFQEQNEAGTTDPNRGSPATGTEDLLLFIDVVESLVKAAYRGPALVETADELARQLHRVRWKNGRVLFNDQGNRHSGTGEHVVYLRPPALKNGRVAPQAELEIWFRSQGADGKKLWILNRYFTVDYDGYRGE